MSTKDRILNASIDLFSQYGYKAVTTKQIAQTASVNEVTLFRHFGTKQNILEETIDKFVFEVAVKEMFEEGIVWDLEKDLLFIAKAHNEIMTRNRKIFLIMIKEFKILEDEEKNPFIKFPKKLIELLIKYFIEMQNRGLVKKDNPEAQATSLLFMSFGIAMGRLITRDELVEGSFDEYLSYGVKTLVRGLAP
ncbi:TetR/AcrR family transcriptional regulator [Wukongibacter baidiensis]|uniref:TetR/AcrR family transcriptional regulator n=1 Tax=Wukongibacter baidiensis TaxID=1723361 RepID=UPI003D7F7D70